MSGGGFGCGSPSARALRGTKMSHTQLCHEFFVFGAVSESPVWNRTGIGCCLNPGIGGGWRTNEAPLWDRDYNVNGVLYGRQCEPAGRKHFAPNAKPFMHWISSSSWHILLLLAHFLLIFIFMWRNVWTRAAFAFAPSVHVILASLLWTTIGRARLSGCSTTRVIENKNVKKRNG